MRKLVFTVFALFFLLVANASATVIVDPNVGWDGYFGWNDGLGQIDSINSDTSHMTGALPLPRAAILIW